MSIHTLENEIVRELREITGKQKLTKNSIMEWSTTDITPAEGEILVKLPKLGLYVAYVEKKPVKKTKA